MVAALSHGRCGTSMTSSAFLLVRQHFKYFKIPQSLGGHADKVQSEQLDRLLALCLRGSFRHAIQID